jgi:hypothetical protein
MAGRDLVAKGCQKDSRAGRPEMRGLTGTEDARVRDQVTDKQHAMCDSSSASEYQVNCMTDFMRTDERYAGRAGRQLPTGGQPFHWRLLLAPLVIVLSGVWHAEARAFRVSQLPNGNVFSCANCHVNPAGGGPRNAFGQAVEAITGTSGNPFWSPALAQQDSDKDGASNGAELGDPDGDGTPIPGVAVFNPGNAASTPPPPPIQIAASSSGGSGPAVALQWTGGTSPFLVQAKSSLTDTQWRNVMTTSNRAVVVAAAGQSGFFRVGGNATNNVIPLTSWLSGEAEIPAVVSSGTGLGTFALEGNTLRYDISYSGLTGDAQAAHIHGPAASTNSADVLYPLAGASGKAGLLSGTVVLSDADKASLLGGETYVNIHTSTQAGGEIRGQIQPAP